MNNNETSAKRLKKLIEKKHFKMKEFAFYSDIHETTLSRYVNGKQEIPDKYLRKVAGLLNVSFEYLKCESDDPTPPEYVAVFGTSSQEVVDYNKQQFQFSKMEDLLVSFGVGFEWFLRIDEKLYKLGSGSVWYLIDDDSMEDETLDQTEFISEIYKHSGKCRIWAEMSFKDRVVELDYSEYKKWMRSMCVGTELEIQKKFDLFYNLSLIVADSDIDRALEGKPRLKDGDDDTFDLYGVNSEDKSE